MSDVTQTSMLDLTTRIVAAHIGHNEVSADALPGLIASVYRSLASVDEHKAEPVQVVQQMPAVPAKKSVFPDYIVCLEDGKKLKMMKRYLQTNFNLSPADYRAKWRLPADYPMVAPNYASKRAELAKVIGLGRKVKEKVEEHDKGDAVEPQVTMIRARRAKGSRG